MDKVDVIIIGAGIAGITSAYYLQKNCPHLTYTILESRNDLGGTWDLMKFPGVRSDTDMCTYGFSFNPWQGKMYAPGEDIKNYIDQTAQKFNIKKHIVFGSTVKSLEWNEDKWTIKTNNKKLSSKYVVCCTGSIDYENPHTPNFKNQNSYQGTIVHSQFWNDTDCRNKHVTIVGSGASSTNIASSIGKVARSVTMVQRSPSWIVNINSNEVSTRRAKTIQHVKSYLYSRIFKKKFKEKIVSAYKYGTGKLPLPTYDFWDQRPVTSLDYDYFNLLNQPNVSVKCQPVDSWTQQGLKLANGEVVRSDITVLATGLTIKLLGGVKIKVNGKTININDTSWYRGMMYSGIPNLFSTFGYVNFSWTARCELIGKRICKTINYMTKKKFNTCIPKYLGKNTKAPLQSNYILRAMSKFPNKIYKFYQNYLLEYVSFTWSKINDGAIEFK